MRKSRFTDEEGTVAPVGTRKPRRIDHWDDQVARSRNGDGGGLLPSWPERGHFLQAKGKYGGIDVSDARRLRALE